MLAVRDANRRFDLELPESGGYTTIAGFLMTQAGRLLMTGDKIEHEGAQFRVERVDRRRIRWVRFTPAPKEEPSDGERASIQALLPFVGTASLATRAGAELGFYAELLPLSI
jgi:Mg2+/Co2+ transporter CorC